MEVNGGGGVWLPEDVIFAVLSWLPVKPLCRFRCVSKGWRALISSPGFIAAQKSRAAPLLVGVFAAPPDDDEPAERRNFPPGVCVVLKVPDDELRVMDADGNVLRVLRNMISSYDNLLPTRLDLVCVDKWRSGASVIDPATRRVVTVRRRVHGNVNASTNRFGRAAPSGAYKVIRFEEKFFGVEHGYTQLCEVATLGDDDDVEPTWRQSPAPPFHSCSCVSCSVTINGVIYFLPLSGCRQLDRNSIACFDLESEEWKKIHGPKLRHSWEGQNKLRAHAIAEGYFHKKIRSGLDLR